MRGLDNGEIIPVVVGLCFSWDSEVAALDDNFFMYGILFCTCFSDFFLAGNYSCIGFSDYFLSGSLAYAYFSALFSFLLRLNLVELNKRAPITVFLS